MFKLKAHKGFEGHATSVDPEDNIISGEVCGIQDVVTFHAENPALLQKAFEEAVEDYLEVCQIEGIDPRKPFSGKIALRLTPEAHGLAMLSARRRGLSLNAWLVGTIEERLGAESGPASIRQQASESEMGAQPWARTLDGASEKTKTKTQKAGRPKLPKLRAV